MARTVRNGKIDTPSARARLARRVAPYWTVLHKGAAVGYRKGAKGGTWIARLRDDAGNQHHEAIGAADDATEADGVTVLAYAQAQTKAREWFARKERELHGEPATPAKWTVADALDDYVDWLAGLQKKSAPFARYTADAFILPAFGKVPVSRLTKGRIEKWHGDLAKVPARQRTRPGAAQRYREKIDQPAEEVARQRQATANRILSILKAALNRAYSDGKVTSDDAWRKVKPFRGVDAARVRYLSDAESQRLVNACDPAFRPMVRAALLTGCRYGELTAARVKDFNPDAGTLTIPRSKSGKARHVVLTDEGREFFASAAAGKTGDHLLLPNPDGNAWGKSHQTRPMELASEHAGISPAVSFHILRHSYASRLVMKAVPLFVVATQLGHGDTRMVEKHYGHLAPNYVADTIRAAFGNLGIVETSNVTPLQRQPAKV